MKLKDRLKAALARKPIPVILCTGALAAAVIAGGYWGITAVLDPYDCRMLDGVSIGGLDVSGMSKAEARKALKTALEETLYREPLTVCLPKETLYLSPEDTDVRVSVSKAVSTAYKFGRDEAQSASEISLLPHLKVNEEYIRSVLADYAARCNTDLVQASWKLEGEKPELSTGSYSADAPCQTLLLTMGIPTTRLEASEVFGEILAEYNRAIPDCREGSFTITPEITPEAVPDAPDLDAIYQELSTAPADDSLDMESYQMLPGSYGYDFDLEQTRALVESTEYGQTLRIPMRCTEPEILGDEVYFRDVLGSCETKHNDDENRNTNLRLLCEALDGVILQPGEEFSYNGTVGERTEEKGYKPATAYSGSRMVKDIGGGVCQGSTTLYNCALLADVEILERVCHGAKVGYVPLGLDAAVNWNTKTDLRFRNNFHFPMMIKAEVSDGYVKMQILGTDEKDYYIEMRCGVGDENNITYAVSYKCKYDKQTGELLSKDVEARSTYYTLDD